MSLKQYITVREAAALYGISDRAIRKKISDGEFSDIKKVESNRGKGGISYRISLDCLPAAIAAKYIGTDLEKPKKDFLQFTDKQRDAAYMKRNVVKEYELYARKHDGTQKIERFLTDYNEKHPEQKITKDMLYDWMRRWNLNHDIVDLIDTRGGKNKGKDSISAEAWDYFCSLYLDQRERSIQICYDLTKKKFSEDDEIFPSYQAFKRKVKKIPDSVFLSSRKGTKATKDDLLPYIGRSTANLESNEIWQSDHKLMDVFVRDENDHLVRLWLTSWMDIRSRRIVGCFLRHGDPNTDTVLHTLHIAIKNTGRLPQQLYTDNGKDYKAKAGLRLDVPDSLASRLGIKKIINALPYNGQAKMIERYHRTIDDRFAKMWPSYAGKDAKERPEDLKDLPLNQIPTIAEFETAFFNWLEEDYHNRIHKGSDMGDTPNNVYAAHLSEIDEDINMEEINHIFMKRTSRTVQQNGVHVYEKDFWHENLVPYIGQKVNVLTEYNDIQHALIETMDGKLICRAAASMIYMYGEDAGQYEEIARKRKKVNKFLREARPKAEIDIHDEIMECNKKTRLQEIGHEKDSVAAKETVKKETMPASNHDTIQIDTKAILNLIQRQAVSNG